jgi:hypothetical protein
MADFKITSGPELDYYSADLCWLGVTRHELAVLRTIAQRDDLQSILKPNGSSYGSEESPEKMNFYFTIMSEREVPKELIDEVVNFIEKHKREK